MNFIKISNGMIRSNTFKLYIPSRIMPTLVEEIVSHHVKNPVEAGDNIEELPIDKLLINDVAAVQLIELYRQIEDILRR